MGFLSNDGIALNKIRVYSIKVIILLYYPLANQASQFFIRLELESGFF